MTFCLSNTVSTADMIEHWMAGPLWMMK